MTTDIKVGDYCLATKWGDGHAGDHWAVGFYEGMVSDRYSVVDSNGQRFRATGFRRCEVITQEQGDFLLTAGPPLELTRPDVSVWDLLESYKKAKPEDGRLMTCDACKGRGVHEQPDAASQVTIVRTCALCDGNGSRFVPARFLTKRKRNETA